MCLLRRVTEDGGALCVQYSRLSAFLAKDERITGVVQKCKLQHDAYYEQNDAKKRDAKTNDEIRRKTFHVEMFPINCFDVIEGHGTTYATRN